MIKSNSNNLIAVTDMSDESIDTNTRHVINCTSESRFSAPNCLKSILDTPATVGGYVINKSHATLSHTELTVLDKGLTFVTTETRPKRQRHLQEFDNFARKLRLTLHANRGERRTTQETQTTVTHTNTQTPQTTLSHKEPPMLTARHRSRDDPFGTQSRQTTPSSKNTSKEHASR